MTNLEIGLVGFAVLFFLLAIRMPVGTAMLIVGTAGIWIIHPRGGEAAIATLGVARNAAVPLSRHARNWIYRGGWHAGNINSTLCRLCHICDPDRGEYWTAFYRRYYTGDYAFWPLHSRYLVMG